MNHIVRPIISCMWIVLEGYRQETIAVHGSRDRA